ncbi:M20 family metallopeptidase [Candidatus Nanohalovita haloferacivicina]|uniref:M20 family metallopeptidase n=1 Tax=Candidatus Nanohalovita haloferacivicina TaxID=2978046 RepID=UPI00325FD3AA|nr:Succinyl-diaminopimelate desuccinylase [Candidatus Nanohalobia archaeon BNXNv]
MVERDPVELTKELIKYRSVKSNPEELDRTIEFIQNYFSGSEFITRRYEKDGKPSLVVLFEETHSPDIMLHGHIDVVEAEDRLFEPEESGDWLYGRGSADMKSGVAALMILMKKLGQRENQPSVGLMIVSDEEIGGFKGIKYLLEEEGYRPSFGLSAEPRNTEVPEITTEQKGVFKIDVTSKGKGSHASQPWNGQNSAVKLLDAFKEITEELPESSKDKWTTTAALTTIKGGKAKNTVTPETDAHIDVRFTQEKDLKKIKDILAGNDIEYSVLDKAPKMQAPISNNYVKALKKACKEVEGECRTEKSPEASDMRYFSDKGVPAVVFGPTGYNLHAENEKLYKPSLSPYINIMERFIDKIDQTL